MPESKVTPPTPAQRWVFAVKGGMLTLVPYGSNIIRVTYTPGTEDRTVRSGWGIIASPSEEGAWHRTAEADGDGVRSESLTLTVNKETMCLAAARPDGTALCQFTTAAITPATVNGLATHHVQGVFSAAQDEHFFGLGQHQDGALDLRGHTVNIWASYGTQESVGVPFVVSTLNYGIVWDNPSKTTVACGIDGKTTWNSETGDAVAFFLLTGTNSDEIYRAYRRLTGITPIPPKAALGLIQSKARYASQDELLKIASGYRQRHDPCDIMVVDYLHWKKLGDLSLDSKAWPDPKAMNAQLHEMGFHTMISVWPDFAVGSNHYDEVVAKKLVLTDDHGAPAGMAKDSFHRDACIDSTNSAARVWLWDKIASGYRTDGFDYFWMDETEPDVQWHDLQCSLGPCADFYNVYPLMHNSALYQGQRSVSNERVMLLTRAAYLGSQRNATTFWSSDIKPSWEALRKQLPTGLNVCATGFPYWSSDTAGWTPLPKTSHPAKVLLDPEDARDVVGQDDDYPELFVRWTEYSVFCPTFRLHGNRKQNEVWSFGKAAEPILENFLKLRYRLLPYIYSQARATEESGAPFMRALFMDFPKDPKVLTLTDEYMFGPAFLVAPITEQGTTRRSVYLPAGTDWYDFWTNQRYRGGQIITADAPIQTLPLYVRAGSILPLGSAVEDTQQVQLITELRVYQGNDGVFSLYDDDGHSYGYESGDYSASSIHYSEGKNAISVVVVKGSAPKLPSVTLVH